MSSRFHPFGGRVSNHLSNRQLSPDDPVLSYYDVRLFREDVDSIKDKEWLTDSVICFWEEYLEREKLIDYPKARINLLRPSMSELLRQTPDPRTLRTALPDFTKTTHVFIPVNDNHDVTRPEGGSHWSLLLVSIVDGVAFHYDSLCQTGGNVQEAHQLTSKLALLLGKQLRFVNMLDAPQQDNGSDCGVFVCLEMQHLLLTRLLRVDSRAKVNMSLADKEIDCAKGRREMLKIIEGFRKEGVRRSSELSRHSPFSSTKDRSRSPPRIGEEQDGHDAHRHSH